MSPTRTSFRSISCWLWSVARCTTEFGGSVYADDVDHALDLAVQLRSRSCSVNGAPWVGGGVGPLPRHAMNGLGPERGVEGLLDYVKHKSVALPTVNDVNG